MQRDMFPTPHPHPQLEPIEPVQSAHPFPIHEPAFRAAARPRSADNQTAAEHEQDLERVLPDTFFFETSKEPFNDPVLFRCVRCDELPAAPVTPTGLPEPTTLENQVIVTAEDRRTPGTERAGPVETCRFDRALCLLGSTAQRELVADHFAIVTVNHSR
jgi:hypothetical protein